MQSNENLDEAVPDRGPEPAESFQQREAVSEVLEALRSIPEGQQEVIRLKLQEGLSYKEISLITQHSESYVGFLIHVGMQALRQKLKSAGGAAAAEFGGTR